MSVSVAERLVAIASSLTREQALAMGAEESTSPSRRSTCSGRRSGAEPRA
jgi:hypothetical protein